MSAQGEVVGPQGHAHVVHAGEAGDHAEHDEARVHRQHLAPRPRQGQAQHLDDLVEFAEQRGHVRRDAQGLAQGLGQAGAPGVRVAVDVHAGEDLQPFRSQALRLAFPINFFWSACVPIKT